MSRQLLRSTGRVDLAAFNRLMRELDGTVDVLSVGGTEIAFHVDGEVLMLRSTSHWRSLSTR